MLLIVGYEDALVGLGDRSHHHIQRAPRPAHGSAFRHQAAPHQCSPFVERQHAATEQSLRPFGTGKPIIQLSAFLARRLLENTATNLRQAQRRNEQSVVRLVSQPFQHSLGWQRFRYLTDDVCVQQISRHRLTFLPATAGRSVIRSAPTRGERRRAARIPPFAGASQTISITSERILFASSSSCASFFARERIRSRSLSRPRTSNRATPLFLRRMREFLRTRFAPYCSCPIPPRYPVINPEHLDRATFDEVPTQLPSGYQLRR